MAKQNDLEKSDVESMDNGDRPNGELSTVMMKEALSYVKTSWRTTVATARTNMKTKCIFRKSPFFCCLRMFLGTVEVGGVFLFLSWLHLICFIIFCFLYYR